MPILKLLFVFLSTKGNAPLLPKKEKGSSEVLLYSLLFLAIPSSAVCSLIKSYCFATDANVSTIRNVPSIAVTK